ncbi:GNAT family N-acetyltransferase [Kutzneria viridogrisea]|uniref:N-acetyltransferase domain-containing protein n=2 Tax=Kutzneria TaxID=43356 RepID=W5W9N0_9PSEU|nr:GNAT family N-acetyltransferase [Kutzneria albida]AHH94914.1 hypothetical protein KALB_1542 [Kutzneria albida DSM 43870]MBA8927754.1 putative acetyltransferase [Kutzneria viridogrisea]
MSDSSLVTRTLIAAEIPEFVTMVFAAFLDTPTEQTMATESAILEPERTHAVFDGETMIGGGSILSRRMTLPGGLPTPVAAVTMVGVAPGHRRRGAMSSVMRAQLHGLHEQGAEPIATLFASEGGIYSRFGYGAAAMRLEISVPSGTEFWDSVDVGEHRVRELDRATALPLIDELHRAVSTQRTGWLSRTPASWEQYFSESEKMRRIKGRTPYRFVLHPDGYAIYFAVPKWGDRGPEGTAYVSEVVARTPVAYAAVWRYLLDIDLIGTVTYEGAPTDEPIQHLLTDPYQAEQTRYDSLWVRLVDVDRALPLRRYRAPLDVVIDLSDEFCPWNTGRWRLVVGTDEVATVERTEAAADLAMTANELGALFLGGTSALDLAAAQRIQELTPGALRTASRAFSGDHQPHCPEVF